MKKVESPFDRRTIDHLEATNNLIGNGPDAWKRTLLLLKVQFDSGEIRRGETGSPNDIAGDLLYRLCEEWEVR